MAVPLQKALRYIAFLAYSGFLQTRLQSLHDMVRPARRIARIEKSLIL
jgi:hypothetical protein